MGLGQVEAFMGWGGRVPVKAFRGWGWGRWRRLGGGAGVGSVEESKCIGLAYV